MSIDVDSETLLTLAAAREAFPGKDRVSPATIHRWRLHGVRGVRLETLLIGGQRFTSREAISRFIDQQNHPQGAVDTSVTPAKRARQSEAARTVLQQEYGL